MRDAAEKISSFRHAIFLRLSRLLRLAHHASRVTRHASRITNLVVSPRVRGQICENPLVLARALLTCFLFVTAVKGWFVMEAAFSLSWVLTSQVRFVLTDTGLEQQIVANTVVRHGC